MRTKSRRGQRPKGKALAEDQIVLRGEPRFQRVEEGGKGEVPAVLRAIEARVRNGVREDHQGSRTGVREVGDAEKEHLQ